MKTLSLILKLALLSLFSNTGFTQSRNSAIQFSTSFARTFQYNSPISLLYCDEGCLITEFSPAYAQNFDISVYRVLAKAVSIKLGVGLVNFNQREIGLSGNGDGSFTPFNYTMGNTSFYTIGLGIRHIANPEKKAKLFVESSLAHDIPTFRRRGFKNSFSISENIGLEYQFTQHWALLTSGFFRSAISRYNQNWQVRAYFPYAYGIQVGVRLAL